MKDGPPISDVDPEIKRRCFGKQTPITPHAQRLMVASVKEAKAEAKGKGKSNDDGQKKSKKKNNKDSPSKSKAKAKAKANKKTKDAEPKKKTPYAEAKIAFFTKFPG